MKHETPVFQESVEAWHLLGTTQAKNEHDAAAIAALKSALALEPGNSSAQMALAVSYTNEAYQAQACHMLQGGHRLIVCLEGHIRLSLWHRIQIPKTRRLA